MNKQQLNNKNYIAIADWMVTELNLSARELLIYAIIYGFSQDGESSFSGSLSYLASWLNISDRNNIRRTLSSLIEKGLIQKEVYKLIDKQICCRYKVIQSRGEAKSYDHIFIAPWMIHDLDLKDKNLILYALIYGFSRTGSNSYCQASTEYLGKWIGVQKNHVKERYLKKMIEKGLIRAIESSTENTKYYAVVPTKKSKVDVSQNDHTFPNQDDANLEESQNDHNQSRFDHIQRPKMTTNNLVNNLVDNLHKVNNNISSNIAIPVYLSKEDLSVVVNKEVSVNDFSISLEHDAFDYKKDHDFENYCRYSKINPYLPKLMSFYAIDSFRVLLARWADTSITDKAELLLLDSICSPIFKNRQRQILDLGRKKIKELFRVCQELYDSDNPRDVKNGKKAYVIGVLKIMLQEVRKE